MTVHLDASRDHFGRAIGIYIYDVPDFSHTVDGNTHPITIAAEIKMETVELGTYRDPSLRINLEAAQELMDALWNCGIRPKEQGTAGEISALKGHLEDMRRLVFQSERDEENTRKQVEETSLKQIMWQMSDIRSKVDALREAALYNMETGAEKA